jgi:hypothetical protein
MSLTLSRTLELINYSSRSSYQNQSQFWAALIACSYHASRENLDASAESWVLYLANPRALLSQRLIYLGARITLLIEKVRFNEQSVSRKRGFKKYPEVFERRMT